MSGYTLQDSFSENGFRVEIHHDEDAESPRTAYDNASHFILKDRNYSFPWECSETFDFDRYDWNDIGKALVRRHDAAYVFPVAMFEHSLIALRSCGAVDPLTTKFDKGIVGIAYVTRSEIDSQRPYVGDDWDEAEWARDVVDAELETYTDYVNGLVYGYVIKDFDGAEVDSCWGFYGYDYVGVEARMSASNLMHEPKCTGSLNRQSGTIDHARDCPIHSIAIAV